MDYPHYILEGGALVAVDFEIWAHWFYEDREHGSKRRVALSETSEFAVSTMFLQFGFDVDVPTPLFFETHVFGGAYDDYEEHYATYDEAVLGHKRIVAMVMGEGNP
jgi:hypothetical protein